MGKSKQVGLTQVVKNVNSLQPENRPSINSSHAASLEQLTEIREKIRNDIAELRQLQVELLELLEENVLEMEQYFEKSAEGTVTVQELETLRVRVQLNKHLARYYKLASRHQQLLKEKAAAAGKSAIEPNYNKSTRSHS